MGFHPTMYIKDRDWLRPYSYVGVWRQKHTSDLDRQNLT